MVETHGGWGARAQSDAARQRGLTRRGFVLGSILAVTGLLPTRDVDAMQSPGRSAATDASGAGPLLFGVWQPGAPWEMTPLLELERRLGGAFDVVMWYQGWGAANRALDTQLLAAVADRGATPIITWEPWDYTRGITQPQYRLRRIAQGAFDRYITSWARGLAQYGRPVLLRFAHEANAKHYPWSIGVNGNTVSDFLAAWNRIVTLFRRNGATNVRWVWSMNVEYPGTTPLEQLYPGDDRVDIVGLDGYNGGTALDWGGWLTFTDIFAATYDKVTTLSQRPIFVTEVACAEEGGSKAEWIRRAFGQELPERFPRIRAVIWFNERKETDWRIESSAESLAAFREAMATVRTSTR